MTDTFERQRKAIWAKALQCLDERKVKEQNERYYWDVTRELRVAFAASNISRADEILACVQNGEPIKVDLAQAIEKAKAGDVRGIWREVLWLKDVVTQAAERSELFAGFRRLKTYLADKDYELVKEEVNKLRLSYGRPRLA